MTGQEYIDLSDVKISGLHQKDGLDIPIEDVIGLLDDFKKQLIIADVVKSFVCPNGCGQNGDMGSCMSCVGK